MLPELSWSTRPLETSEGIALLSSSMDASRTSGELGSGVGFALELLEGRSNESLLRMEALCDRPAGLGATVEAAVEAEETCDDRPERELWLVSLVSV